MTELWSGADDGGECEPGHGCHRRPGEARLLRGACLAPNPQILKTLSDKWKAIGIVLPRLRNLIASLIYGGKSFRQVQAKAVSTLEALSVSANSQEVCTPVPTFTDAGAWRFNYVKQSFSFWPPWNFLLQMCFSGTRVDKLQCISNKYSQSTYTRITTLSADDKNENLAPFRVTF